MTEYEVGDCADVKPVTRYRLRRCDKVLINDVAYVPVSADNHGHVLRRVDGFDIEEVFTHVEMQALFADNAVRVERGVFNAPTAEAARFRGYRLSDLAPEKKQVVLFRKRLCDRFLQLKEEDPSISMSDAGMKNALRELGAELDAANREAGAEGRAGRHIGTQRKIPSASTLRRWLKKYKNSGYNPIALADDDPSSGRKTSRSSEEQALYMKHARAYASRNKPTKAICYERLGREIDDLNIERARSGEPQLRRQDRRTFERLIASLDDYFVCRGREGADAANKKFAIVNRGLDVERPFERLEIDEHKVDLMVFLEESGVLNSMNTEQVAALKERERVWLTVALDARTRMVAAMLLTREAPSAKTALATLEMAVKDTSELESVIGAATSFAHGTPETVAVDAGSSFVSDDFEAAVSDIGARIDRSPDKTPQMRGRIESFFGTVRDKVIRHFQGQTFENVVKKGDYDAQANATLNFDELNRVLLKGVLNIYHSEGHSSLGGQSPANCWADLNKYYPVDPPPDIDCRRHIFGLEVERRVGAKGVCFSGIHYQSDELQKLRQREFSSSVKIRVDRFDLSAVSVFQGDGWITVPALFDGLEGVTYWEWRDAVRDFRQRYGEKEKATEGQMRETLAEIRSVAERADERAGIGAPTLSKEEYDRDQERVYRNFEIQRERERVHAPADSDGVGVDDGLGLDEGLGLEGEGADQPLGGRPTAAEESSSQHNGAPNQNQPPKRPKSPKKKKKTGAAKDNVSRDSGTSHGDENDEFGDIDEWTSE